MASYCRPQQLRVCALDRSGTSPYSVLGVRPGSSKQDVRKAYRRLALKYHPDVCKDDEIKFRNVNRAYESLIYGQETSEQNYNDDDSEELWREGWEGPWYYYRGTRTSLSEN